MPREWLTRIGWEHERRIYGGGLSMTGLTDHAKREYGTMTRFRFRLSSAALWFAYKVMPSAYYDEVQRDELEQIARRKGLEVVDAE